MNACIVEQLWRKDHAIYGMILAKMRCVMTKLQHPLLARLLPYCAIAFVLVLFVMGIFLFSTFFIISMVVGFILFAIGFIRAKFFNRHAASNAALHEQLLVVMQTKKSPTRSGAKHSGRVIEHEEDKQDP
jgi:hypothetical protein